MDKNKNKTIPLKTKFKQVLLANPAVEVILEGKPQSEEVNCTQKDTVNK